MKKKKEEIVYSLCEALSDIAYIAGHKQYYSGNSRQDMADFIEWAKEFEEKWKNKEWGADNTDHDYIDEITKFADEKINASQNLINENGKAS